MIWKVGQILHLDYSEDYYKSSRYTDIHGTLFKIIHLYKVWSHKAVSAAYNDLLNNPTPAPAEESQAGTSASEEGSDYRPPRGPGGGRGGGSGGPTGGSRGGGSRGGGSRGGAGRGEGSPQRKRKRRDDEPNNARQNEDEDVEIVGYDGPYLGHARHAMVQQWITEASHSLDS